MYFVVTRTNSNDTTLTINDSTDGKIYHYDQLGKFVVTECGYACYYEYDTTAYAEATKGKVIAKTGGEISVLYATAASVSAKEAEAETTGYTNFSNIKEGNVTFRYVDENKTAYTAETIKSEETKAISYAKDVDELAEINAIVTNDKSTYTGNDYSVTDAVKAVCFADKKLITKHESYIFAYNKSANKFEYLDKNVLLDSNYEAMTVVTTIAELNTNIDKGGMIYLQGTFNATEIEDTEILDIVKIPLLLVITAVSLFLQHLKIILVLLNMMIIKCHYLFYPKILQL